MPNSNGLRIVVLGGTGAVGRAVVKELLMHHPNDHVFLLGRKRLESGDVPFLDISQLESEGRLVQRFVEMDQWDRLKDDHENYDVGISCFGTTRSAAGSAEAFRAVELDAILGFAQYCKNARVQQFCLISAQGANSKSWFNYLHVKGDIENMVKEIKFPRTCIFQPGLLNRGNQARTIEKIVKYLYPSVSVEIVGKAVDRTIQELRDQISSGSSLSSENSGSPQEPVMHIYSTKDIRRLATHEI